MSDNDNYSDQAIDLSFLLNDDNDLYNYIKNKCREAENS